MNTKQRDTRLPNTQQLDLSIVIPLKNEAESISGLIAEIIQTLVEETSPAATPIKTFEILLINDGSEDNTAELIDELAAKNKFISAIHHQAHYGQSRAIHSGVSQAQYEWVLTMDGDGQNDPEDIQKLVSTLLEQQQTQVNNNRLLVIGQRRVRRDSLVKRLSSQLANTIRRRVLKDFTRDTGCSLKLFQRQEFLFLPYFDHIHRFLPALFQRQGVHVIAVSVNHRPRIAGYSKYGLWGRLWSGIVDLIGVYWLIRRYQIPRIKPTQKKVEE